MSIGNEVDSMDLIQAENESLREEVERHRLNVAKLVEMLTVVTAERDELRKAVAARGKTSLVMRIGEMSSLSRNNQRLYVQNRHLQDMVVRLADRRSEPPPF